MVGENMAPVMKKVPPVLEADPPDTLIASNGS
jgi:hypothetical protein